MNQKDKKDSHQVNNNIDIDFHPLTTSIYPANFDYSSFEKFKMNEYNKLSEDDCYNQRKNNDNNKKLKFITTNYIDLLEANQKLNFFGIASKNGVFVPGEQIDNYSNLLNGKNGGTLTNCNVKNGFGQLPILTTPYKGQSQHGDVVIEDSMRNFIEIKKYSCLPKDDEFQNRSFSIFDNGIEVPQAIKSVETQFNGFPLGRNGQSTRFDNKFENKQMYSARGIDFTASGDYQTSNKPRIL